MHYYHPTEKANVSKSENLWQFHCEKKHLCTEAHIPQPVGMIFCPKLFMQVFYYASHSVMVCFQNTDNNRVDLSLRQLRRLLQHPIKFW